jgi:hypothetical protein
MPKGSPDTLYNQDELIEFLAADVDIALTMLETAADEANGDDTHLLFAISRAQIALHTIRRLEGRIKNPTVWQEIHARSNVLQKAIEGFA